MLGYSRLEAMVEYLFYGEVSLERLIQHSLGESCWRSHCVNVVKLQKKSIVLVQLTCFPVAVDSTWCLSDSRIWFQQKWRTARHLQRWPRDRTQHRRYGRLYEHFRNYIYWERLIIAALNSYRNWCWCWFSRPRKFCQFPSQQYQPYPLGNPGVTFLATSASYCSKLFCHSRTWTVAIKFDRKSKKRRRPRCWEKNYGRIPLN